MSNQPPTKREKEERQQKTDAAATHSVSPSVKADKETPQANDVAEHPQQQAGIAKTRRLPEWVEVLLPIFLNAVLLAVIAFQWKAMNDALDETKKSRELEYRAYVAAKGITFIKDPKNPAYGKVSVVYLNTGRTPGLNGRIRVNFERRENPIPEDTGFPPHDAPPGKIVLAPQIEMSTAVVLLGTTEADPLLRPAPESDAKSRAREEPSPTPTPTLIPPLPPKSSAGNYAYGIITHDDIFEKSHQTKFCFVNAPGTGDWVFCPTFNDAN